jgi:uncharacterized metal-binding protein YceD (DUF177 family)
MAEILRIADLNPKKPVRFEIIPTGKGLAAISKELDLRGLRKMRFIGTLTARGKKDWVLDAKLGATVIQDCVVTLEPVTTRIEEPVLRVYLSEWEHPEDSEVEMTQDETTEPLPPTLDLNEVAVEALALALPLFPRAEGAELGELLVSEPGVAPLTQEAARPFAGLADLKKKLEDDQS